MDSLLAIQFGGEPQPDWYIPMVLAPWLVGHVRRRPGLDAHRFERFLFTRTPLLQLQALPCYDLLDSRLVVVANDWIRMLSKLSDREHRSPENRIRNCEAYKFSRLYAMVYRLHELVYMYMHGVPRVRRVPQYHWTQTPGEPRTDVTQARYTMAVLMHNRFGTWLESMLTQGSLERPPTAVFDYTFDPLTGMLGWADTTEESRIPRRRFILDLIFENVRPTLHDHVLKEAIDIEPRSVFIWILEIQDNEDGDTDRAHFGIGNADFSIRMEFDSDDTTLEWAD
ncbi:hypothetical protein F4781DRAFT_213533 [Annulohypoxylon bovei var. microspora]|nr:hypothetical protein F4781DRAFT_213533 [Annulohypoxylon bovei var. microspora]